MKLCAILFFSFFISLKLAALAVSFSLPATLDNHFDFQKVGVAPTVKAPIRHSREPPQYMLDLYNQMASENGTSHSNLPYGASMIRAVIEKDGKGNEFSFSLSGIPRKETILEAEFHFYHHQLQENLRNLLSRHKLYEVKVETSLEVEQLKISSQVLASHASGRRSFVVGSIIRRAQELGLPSVEFTVKALTFDGTALPLQFHHGTKGPKVPLLVLFSNNPEKLTPGPLFKTFEDKGKERYLKSRTKRSIEDNEVTNSIQYDEKLSYVSNSDCHLEALYVDFREVGWPWIVAPEGYNANQCSGECALPFGQHLNPTNHAIILSIMMKVASSNEHLSQPECVPTAYEGISVLFYDEEENVILKTYSKMIATECGCR